jgi:branched-chain amino acid transport system ATP-binding protein
VNGVLETLELSVTYGGVRAIDRVNLSVGESSLVGLIGPNGAGKTSFVDAVTGFTSATGKVLLDGSVISSLGPHARARRGLARTWQSIELFDDMTIGENVVVAASRPSVWSSLKEMVTRPADGSAMAIKALARFGLETFADAMPGELSEGQRKLVGVARALASQPKLLCLDEPAAGLNTQESEQLGRQLRGIVDEGGVSILLIDHDMGLVLGISDYVYVLDFGEVIACGTPQDVRRDPGVKAAYLGAGNAQKVEEAI